MIRDAGQDELEAVARLSVEAYREFESVVGPEVWSRMERNLSRLGGDSPDAVTIVAELDGELAGTAEYLGPGGRRVGLVETVPGLGCLALLAGPSLMTFAMPLLS